MKLLLLALLVSLGCGAFAAETSPVLSKERVVFRTNYGDIAVALYPEVAPKHVAQILRLAGSGIFDGATIYRVEKGFVAQIDNYKGREASLTDAQVGVIEKIPAEFSSIHHRRGLLSMARYDDIDSAESSFSLMLGEADHLDGKYTVFGEVVSGMDVLDVIERTAVDSGSKPLVDIVISRANVFTNGDLSRVSLAGPTQPVNEESPYQFVLKLIAAFAFTIAVGVPFYKSVAKRWGVRTQAARVAVLFFLLSSMAQASVPRPVDFVAKLLMQSQIQKTVQASTCIDEGQNCGSGDYCCGGVICWRGVCGVECAGEGASCSSSADCCDRNCWQGRCH